VTDPNIPPDSGAICLFDAELAPGREYRLATPWQVMVYNNVDEWQLQVTGRNTSTLTVRGDTASGQVGRNVTVSTSVRNNGPARLEGYNQLQGSYSLTTVTLPAGTELVKADPDCHLFSIDFPTPGGPFPVGAELGDGKYYCWQGSWMTPWNLPGETYTYEFTLRITKPGTLRGEILTELSDAGRGNSGLGPIPYRAPIVITATGAPATGNGSGNGGEGGGGGLPITGSNTTVVALIGLALLVAGAGARLASRRR
jgi:LPXTG-motif cell wall-anchored protein